ncbi:UxaA family hydrolase [Flectobacillus roseus]|uniref:Altronate dehydratase family protein n=1 Tax=Flectobacillus roseus TaxID=502259 RepID=A0ABT6Y4Q3_9BACT|nr:altronate dehydratase family protein [Flectobacillus roseus]MDI9858088.1 altronate dehydratase family protein [Flectobacillus roseus]
MKRTFLQINPTDNVLVALCDLKKGEEVVFKGKTIILQDDIAAKHKFTIDDLKQGEEVTMYGVLVGKAQMPIPAGGLIHTFNLKHASEPFQGKLKDYTWQAPDVSAWQNRTFMGYHRSDGQVGTQNYWLVIPLVFCENRNVNIMKQAFLKALGYAQPDLYLDQVSTLLDAYQSGADIDSLKTFTFQQKKSDYRQNRVFKNVDGIKFLTHESGCGENREDSENLCNLLAGYCVNPNVAGITVLSLGCQHSQVSILQEAIHKISPNFEKPLYILEQQQDLGSGESQMLAEAIRQTFVGMIQINEIERKPAPLSKLRVGVKCGGSDGFSGISANPAIGHTADLLVALGANVMIAEFPELCGVEQELQNRAVTAEVADNFGYLMKEYARRAEAVGAGFDMNPSPGNIKDGLITDAIKSAGAAKKAGSSPVVDALGYGQYSKKAGLNLVCTPGNDVLATSGMAGAGATIQLFTTGLGTPTGNPICPMVKLSTNTKLAQKLPEIIDIDCGPIIEGEKSVEEMGEMVLEYIIGLASGEYQTKAMELGQDDFMFWRRGVSL